MADDNDDIDDPQDLNREILKRLGTWKMPVK